MNGPSTHLTWLELACKDGTPYPDSFIADGRLSELAALFEEVRALLGGQPLTITSAYRTRSHNHMVGGATNSQHLEGRALDIRPPAGMTPDHMAGRIKDAWTASLLPSLGGIGVYPKARFVHIDTRRTGGRLVAWFGGAQMKDTRA
jgi:uncharacterized protein YcbK (DUF882 family)